MTLLFDFQCSHCRRLHAQLPELLRLADGAYRIRLCPVPLSSACNPYIPASGIDRFAGSCQLTRFALAVWYARPDAWQPFWDTLLGTAPASSSPAGPASPGTIVPSPSGAAGPVGPAEAERLARELLGDGFEAAVADPRIDTYLHKVEELFGRTSSAASGGIPRFICGQRWLVPETDSAAALLDLLQASF